MIDIWMIFTMTIPLFEIVGHRYSHFLKMELAKEHPNPSDAIGSLPQNMVSVHSPRLEESKYSRRSEAMIN